MRATRMAVVLTAAFALTTVATSSATAAGNGAAATRTTVPGAAVPAVPGLSAVPGLFGLSALSVAPVTVPALPSTLPASEPAAPATSALPAKSALPDTSSLPALPATPDPSAALGAVDDIVKLVTDLLSTVTSAVPDLGALQQLIAALQAALQGLIGQLPALPSLPAPAPSRLPDTATPPSAATVQQQLDALRARAQALTAAARTHPAAG
ncbi:hypothetical protein ACIRST_25070 [Kitasatospora sp. NPDC101447]|uniref:hypothetical protein n=1 Tax=Kitasatospora sp. NPDC101447 TaxID=3364102 RepID=UPI0037F64FA9